MIFAAGIGSRLKPFTDSHPKALAPVAGKPALQWAIDKFSRPDIDLIVVNTHHFADQIKEYLSSSGTSAAGTCCAPPVAISDESDRLLDTGGGLLKAAPMLGGTEPVWLHNADIITDFDLDGMARAFAADGADATLLVSDRPSARRLWFDRATRRLAGWENTATGETRPEGFLPDPAAHFHAAFGGVHLIRPDRVFPLLEEYAGIAGPVFSMTPFYIWAARRLNITACAIAGHYRWFDIGTPEKLERCNAAFSR